jgi:hypothetical protein
MRDLDTIDVELRLLRAVRRFIRVHRGESSSDLVDALLDERLTLSDQRASGVHSRDGEQVRWLILVRKTAPDAGPDGACRRQGWS